MTPRAIFLVLACLFGGVACRQTASDLEYQRAVNAVDDERFDLARRYFAEDLKAHPENLESTRGAGRAWMAGALQSAGHARRYWREVLAAEPGDVEARLQLANTQYLLGEFDAALPYLQGIASNAESDRLRALILLELDPEKLVWLAEGRVAAAGDAEALFLAAAQASELLGRDVDTYRWAQLAAESRPLQITPHYLLSRSLQRQGRSAEAEREATIHRLLQALAAPAGTTKGTVLERLRWLDELEPLVRAPLPGLRRLRLSLLAEARMRTEGRALLDAALADGEGFGATRGQLAAWAERLGELTVSTELLEEELSRVETPDARRALGHRLARLYRATDPAKAESFLRASLEKFPYAARHHCMLGELLVDSGRAEEATRSLERALELAPWRADCRLSLARLLHTNGDPGAVTALLAQAPEPDPSLTQFSRQFGYEREQAR